MIQASKLKPYLQIALWLVAALVVVNIALTALNTTPILSWLPETVTGTGFLEDSRRRVSQAVGEYQLGRVRQDEHLGVFVGISNLREGIELSVIDEAVGPGWRFLGVAGAGFGIRDFAQYADLVLESELKPDLAILGFGLHQLIDIRPRPAGTPTAGLMNDLRNGAFRDAAIRVRNSAWVYSRRQDVNVTVEQGILDLRARLLSRFGISLPQSELDKLSPWREMVRSNFPDHFSPATLAALEKFLEDRGVFELQTYENSPRAFSMLMDSIEGFRRRNTKVVLLLMPEGSTIQRRVPKGAYDVFMRKLQERFPADTPLVLDHRTAIGDEGFVDLVHLNRYGRMEFSRTLGDVIRKELPGGPPLSTTQARVTTGTR